MVTMWGNRPSDTLMMGIQIAITLPKVIWAIPPKLHMFLAFNPASLLLGIYLEDITTTI